MVARVPVAIVAMAAVVVVIASASVALANDTRLVPRASGIGPPGVPKWSLVRGALAPTTSAYVPVRVTWAASGTAGSCYDLTDMQGGSVTATGTNLFGTSQFVQVQG